ncbi:fibronectin type III domain-containing protein 7 [Austrofundulus limnaeus]|uniref:Fibronectin type III domain-containing protein 7 n=1 Tax=Austrofundulus limnaeus TaxID=52670 RepID=A0A2I4AK34_AUSLI|nr:PREDICTED: fibronectin type III domain-containing protein 7-like [Austrofundulus limnaeus]
MQCGNVYNFTVKACDGICNSSFSSPLQAGAAPCPPVLRNVRIQRIKQMHWLMITWDKVNCSNVEYLAKITAQIGNNPLTLMDVSSYWLVRPYFELPMPCSTPYNITLFARNSGGVSKPSSVFSGFTVPCAPQNVKYSGNNQSALLSWDASVLATKYMVYSTSGGNRAVLCNTTMLACWLTNFDPSTTEVTANDAVGESIPTKNITGPVNARRRRDAQVTELFST